MQPVTLTEDSQFWNQSLAVDSSARLIRDVALTGTSSRNGYRYAEEALSQAAPLYDKKPVFLDHATDRQRPQERSTRDLVGSIANPRFIDGRIRGDIRVLETPSGELFLRLAEQEADHVGMSHVVLAQRSADGRTVTQIQEVISVDAVVNPATTRTLRESCQTVQNSKTQQRESSATTDEAADCHCCGDLRQQIATLQQRLNESEQRHLVQSLCEQSQLPQDVLTDCFRQQLLKCESPDERRTLIEDRRQLLAASRFPSGAPARSEQRSLLNESRTADEQFVSTIRRRPR